MIPKSPVKLKLLKLLNYNAANEPISDATCMNFHIEYDVNWYPGSSNDILQPYI